MGRDDRTDAQRKADTPNDDLRFLAARTSALLCADSPEEVAGVHAVFASQ